MSAAEEKQAVDGQVNTTVHDIESKLSDGGLDSPRHTSGHIDPAAERRLLWKLDFTIYPILYIVYMMSFLDRINISNARIQGMTKELNLTGNRFNIALFVSGSS